MAMTSPSGQISTLPMSRPPARSRLTIGPPKRVVGLTAQRSPPATSEPCTRRRYHVAETLNPSRRPISVEQVLVHGEVGLGLKVAVAKLASLVHDGLRQPAQIGRELLATVVPG